MRARARASANRGQRMSPPPQALTLSRPLFLSPLGPTNAFLRSLSLSLSFPFHFPFHCNAQLCNPTRGQTHAQSKAKTAQRAFFLSLSLEPITCCVSKSHNTNCASIPMLSPILSNFYLVRQFSSFISNFEQLKRQTDNKFPLRLLQSFHIFGHSNLRDSNFGQKQRPPPPPAQVAGRLAIEWRRILHCGRASFRLLEF